MGNPPPPRCPLCDFVFGADHATGADATPYAKAYLAGDKGWRSMSEWVWFAGTERLKHLALMRASAASRRFCRLNVLLLSFALGCFQATRIGWRWVSGSAAVEATHSLTPRGEGWLHVAATPRPLPQGLPPERFVDLWWNPTHTVMGFASAFIAGLLGTWLVLVLLRRGVAQAHLPSYRVERRMTAALHYGTAWFMPLLVAALVAMFRPLAYIGAIARWPWHPPQSGFDLSAAVIASFAIAMGWFWLIRLGATAPQRTRSRVVAFFAVGAPILAAGVATGWWWGLNPLYDVLFNYLHLEF